MSDFLYLVGVDVTQADRDIQAFVKRTTAALQSIGKTKAVVDIDTRSVSTKLTNIANRASEADSALRRLGTTASGSSFTSGARGISGLSSALDGNTRSIGANKDAWGLLGRIAGNTVFKFVEYEIIMKAFNGTVKEFMNSINQAAGVQLETTIQHLYNGTLNTNKALNDSIIIARQWGADIMDVQQAIGLWTKQTNDLSAAAYLADKAEQMHRASGIESQEVYRMSISMVQQLGLKLKELPAVYDEVANAALKVGVPLQALPGKGGGNRMEAMKEIFEGLAASSATLKAMGFDTAGIIAVVSNQIQAAGEHGKEAAKNLTSMFAALEGKGQYRANFEAITGHFKDTNDLIDKMITKAPELYQAYANGQLGVRPQQFETLQTFEASLKRIKQLRGEIANGKSNGTLNLVSQSMMSTFLGQMDRLKASFQQFNLALGNQLLPTATSFVRFLNGSMFPALASHAGMIVQVAKVLGGLGVAYLALAGEQRFKAWLVDQQTALRNEAGQMDANILVSKKFQDSELATADGMKAAIAQMEREQLALKQLQEAINVAEWRTTGLRTATNDLGVSMSQVATLAETKVPTAFATMATGIKTAMSGALSSLGGLLKMYGLMTLITSAAANMDKSARIGMAADLDATYNYHTGAKGAVSAGLRGIGLAVSNPLLMPDNKDYNSIVNDLRHKKGGPGTEGYAMRYALYRRQLGQKRHNQGAMDDANDSIKQLVLAEVARRGLNVPGLDDIMKGKDSPALDHGIAGTGAQTEPFANLPGKKNKDTVSEQQAFAESVNKTKRDAMSTMTKWANTAAADQKNISTLELLAKSFGATELSIRKVEAAYKDESKALANEKSAAQGEISQLTARIAAGKALQSHKPKNSKEWYGEQKAIDMATAAITKAHGRITLIDAAQAHLNATMQTTINTMRSQNALSQIVGVRSEPTPFGTIHESIVPATQTLKDFSVHLHDVTDEFKKAKAPVIAFNAAVNAQGDLKKVGSALLAEYNRLQAELAKGNPVNAQYMAQLLALVRAYSAAYGDATTAAADANTKVTELSLSVKGLFQTVNDNNLTTLTDILGIDKAHSDALKELETGYQSILTDVEKLNKLEADYHGAIPDEIRTEISLTREQLALRLQLVEADAKSKEIRNSTTYKATESVLQSTGDSAISNWATHFIGAAKTGLRAMVGDWLKQVVEAWWKQTAAKITDSLFKTPAQQQEQRLRQMYADNLKALQLLQQQEKKQVVDALGKTITGDFKPSVDKLTPALITSSKSMDTLAKALNAAGKGGAKGGGGGGSQDASTSFADAMAQAFGFSNADTASGSGWLSSAISDAATQSSSDPNSAQQQTADNTAAASDSLSKLIDMVKGGGSGGAGGIASTLLGTLAENSPAIKKFLGTPTGTRIGNAVDGIAEGQMFGQQMGGGSHSTWGSVGGAIGGYFGGPVGATIGSFIGSQFGWAPTLQKNPDILDTTNWGQFLANFGATNGSDTSAYGETHNQIANGQSFTIDPSTAAATNNKGIGQYVHDSIAGKSDQQLQAMFGSDWQAIKNMFSQWDSRGMHDGKNGNMMIGNATYLWTDIQKYGEEAMKALGSAANKAAAPLLTIAAYGGGAGYQINPYNMPGITSSEYQAFVGSQYASLPQNANYYATPGLPGTGPTTQPVYRGNGTNSTAQLMVTTNVVLDGKTVAQVVNAYNNAEDSRYNRLAA